MDFSELRRLAIISVFSDDDLFDLLVLKGGNALNLVHGIGARTSLDLDFSMEGDFPDEGWARSRLIRGLEARFDSAGYQVFDVKLQKKPARRGDRPAHWGGYFLEFKVIEHETARRLKGDFSRMSRQATITSPGQGRKLKLEISHHEYCGGKQVANLDEFEIYVYPPELIAIEKLRAICQQMEPYYLVRNKRARARDFYDICAIVDATGFDSADRSKWPTIRKVFDAKEVRLSFLGRIEKEREFHRTDWDAVRQSVNPAPRAFDVYFDRVVELVSDLHPLWEK